jgi:hypothetical protein
MFRSSARRVAQPRTFAKKIDHSFDERRNLSRTWRIAFDHRGKEYQAKRLSLDLG